MGESATVQCSISIGDLPIRFRWLLNGEAIESLTGTTMGSFGKKTSVLNIDSLTEKHAGNYTCLVRNRAGTSLHTSLLIVNGI